MFMVQRTLDGSADAGASAEPGGDSFALARVVEPFSTTPAAAPLAPVMEAPASTFHPFTPTAPAPVLMSLNANRDVMPISLRPAPVADSVAARAPDLLSVAFDWRKWWPWLALLLLIVVIAQHKKRER